jgi:hypothetical protein
MSPDGKLIGEFASPAVGHDILVLQVPGLKTRVARGHAVAITIGKRLDGTIAVLGSGGYPLPGGQPLSQEMKDRARRLVE